MAETTPDFAGPLNRQLSRLIAGDVPDPEQEPLTRQASTNRIRFERNRRFAAQSLVLGSMCVLCLFQVLFATWAFLSVYFYIKGWLVYMSFGQGECDQSLGTWLLLALLLPMVTNSSLVRRQDEPQCCQWLGWLLSFSLLVLGLIWLSHSQTCDDTNPELYNFVKAYMAFLTVTWSLFLALPLAALILIVLGMHFGWFENVNGADPKTISKIETLKFDPDLFTREGEEDDSKLPGECCVCMDRFGPDMTIKRTPCHHCFHEECLGKWLKVTTTCPICRNDLEQAVQHADMEAGVK
eukprot:gb/GFBE01077047.1/.p1 GENE.gb/GFBE01077047.1/~~gb/GFBE01077047.1/.p1  ORF type:complete len:295 (+),score=40.31 gb/GFBE01077047.1/:1-885(+)